MQGNRPLIGNGACTSMSRAHARLAITQTGPVVGGTESEEQSLACSFSSTYGRIWRARTCTWPSMLEAGHWSTKGTWIVRRRLTAVALLEGIVLEGLRAGSDLLHGVLPEPKLRPVTPGPRPLVDCAPTV